MRIKPTIVTSVVLLVGIVAALPVSGDRPDDYEWFDPVIIVRRYLLDGFHEEPDEQAMQEAMIEAMVDVLDDDYTMYVPPAGEAEFNKALRGTYVGIGAEVNTVDDYLTIVSPLEDSPALAAGVRAGDVVLEIDGLSTTDRTIDECIDLLLGEPGTPVTIRVRHLDATEEDMVITRRQIVTPTVKGVRRAGEAWDYWLDEDAGIGYIRLTQFNQTSADRLRDGLAALDGSRLKGLVLDLRGNPGGELNIAVEIADLFLREGLIVAVRGRNRQPQSWYARPEGTMPDFAMVVLVNRHSASASEIVAGALQANGRAKVLGTRTFGKGSVQEVIELPYHQGTLKMTSGHYYLASGRNISPMDDSAVWGVDPDPGFVVAATDDDYLAMFEARREFEIISDEDAGPGGFSEPAWIREHLHDPELAAALAALEGRLASGTWPSVGEGDPTELAVQKQIEGQARLQRRLLDELERVEQRLRELHGLAEMAGREALVPADADLHGATITLRDGGGAVLGTWRIEDGDPELALEQLRLNRVEPE